MKPNITKFSEIIHYLHLKKPRKGKPQKNQEKTDQLFYVSTTFIVSEAPEHRPKNP